MQASVCCLEMFIPVLYSLHRHCKWSGWVGEARAGGGGKGVGGCNGLITSSVSCVIIYKMFQKCNMETSVLWLIHLLLRKKIRTTGQFRRIMIL